MSRFLFGMVCGALLLYTSMHYHVVRSDEGFHLVPKLSQDFSNIYTDIRGFTINDWQGRKRVAAAIMQADKADLLGESAIGGVRESVDRWLTNFLQ